MITTMRIATAFVAIGILGACVETTTPVAATTPTLAVQGCLRDVSNTTNNGQVTVLEAFESEAGTEVTVGVGPELAPWRCIGYSDGTTAGIMSMVDEGAL